LFGSTPSPSRILIETFDFIEICCGPHAPLSAAVAKQGLRVGPLIDILKSPLWDIRETRVVEWILFLIERRRVFCLHSGVPCTDFSIAKYPKPRTREEPWGKLPLHPDRHMPNFMLACALSCLLAAVRAKNVAMTHEHPASAFSWQVPFWSWFERQPGCEIGRFSGCAFGAKFQKDTRLARCNAGFLAVLDRPCQHTAPHEVRLAGGLTRAASEYLNDFCEVYAQALSKAVDEAKPELGIEEAAAFAVRRRGAYESLWLNEWVRGAAWRVTRSRREHDPVHINIREVRTLLCEVCRVGAQHPGSHVLGTADSRVSIGAAGKGRSASAALNSELKIKIPDIIGFDIYPGYLFSPTRIIPADDPSRLRPLRAHGRPYCPDWWIPLQNGDYDLFDYWARLPKQSRDCSEWARLVVKLLLSKGRRLKPKDDVWDSTLGYPGEGPPPRSLPRPQDAALDLRSFRNLTPVVAQRRARLLCEFATFVHTRSSLSLGEFLEHPAGDIDRHLSDFGQLLFRTARSRGDYSETINAVVDARRGLRGSLQAAWEVSWVWRSLLPAGNRVAMPEQVFYAIMAIAVGWGWHDVAIVVGAGFLGLLRPHELRALLVSDLLTPFRLLASDGPMFVTIRLPKMRRLTARRSYTRIDHAGFIQYVDACTRGLSPATPIFPGSYAQLRAHFNRICAHLSVPTGAPHGLSLGSLRPGGATALYRRTDNSELVRFRGRWANARMLETYIQEVGAVSLLPALSASTRERIAQLAAAAPAIMAAAAAANF